MKGLGRLIKNELIKIFGQLSWKIITVIILVLAILSPVFSVIFGSSLTSDYNYYEIEYEAAENGSLEKEYFGTLMTVDKLFEDNGISYDDWRYNVYYENYRNAAVTLRGLQLVADGKGLLEVFEVFGAYNVYVDYDQSSPVAVYYDELTGEDITLTDEIAVELLEEYKVIVAKTEDLIINGTVASYAEYYIPVLEEELQTKQVAFDSATEEYNNKRGDIFDLRAANFNLYATKVALDVWNNVKSASREDEGWLLNTADAVLGYSNKGEQLSWVDEESFIEDSALTENYGSYDKYFEIMDKRYHENIAALNILKYSAENGKPLPEMENESVRYDIMVGVADNASIVLFMCIILAASIVASEHMSGTVRLLLIRPRARWKILLSKLLSVVIYGIAAFAATSVLTVGLTLIFNGTGDLSVPMLVYRHGAVKEVSLWIYIIAKNIVDALPELFAVSLAFAISVITKKTVFSVTVPMLITMFSSAFLGITTLFRQGHSVLRWTLLPYFDMEMYTDHVVNKTTGYYEYIAGGYDTTAGAILFTAYIAVIIAISFIVFRRQQIKN